MAKKDVMYRDVMYHGIKARKIGSDLFERGGHQLSLRFINGKIWFSHGSFVRTQKGRESAEKLAHKMRAAGFPARIVTLSEQIQVFCPSRTGAVISF